MGPNPPAGATVCGSGTFNGAQALAECKTGVQFFSLLPAVNDACGQALMGSGEWTAWCTADKAYIWTKFHDVEASGTAACKYWTLRPLFRSSQPGGGSSGDTGNSAKSGYWGTPIVGVSTTKTDVAIWITVDRKTGEKVSASLYLAAGPDLFLCGVAAPGRYIMLGAPVMFTPQ